MVTEGRALVDLNLHIEQCGYGCVRDGIGISQFSEMCDEGQELVMRYLEAEDDA